VVFFLSPLLVWEGFILPLRASDLFSLAFKRTLCLRFTQRAAVNPRFRWATAGLAWTGNGDVGLIFVFRVMRFFHFYIKKTKFQKYMSNREIFKKWVPSNGR